MEEYSRNDLAEIRKILSDIENEIKESRDEYSASAPEAYQELISKYDELTEKIEELSKKQATSLKILTVLQQQTSGLKVGLNNLEDMLEGIDKEKPSGGGRNKRIPKKTSSGKIFKWVMGFIIIVFAFFMVNRWITAYLNRNWSPRTQSVPGIYESLERPGGDRNVPEASRPYVNDIQSKIDEKLEALVPESGQQPAEDPVQPQLYPATEAVIEIFVPRVLILNGCGVSGIAARLSQHLTRNGIRVVDSKNADNFNYPMTIVYSTSDNPQDHVWLGLIGVQPNTVKPLNAERDNANTVIILGKDYRSLPIF
jgi:hypothetical protein